jgi:hypothetical protein
MYAFFWSERREEGQENKMFVREGGLLPPPTADV